MATLFMNNDPATGKKEQGKSRGRKPSNGATTQKKPPQRGMGVEKLERLRIQERWKKMTEAATAPQLDQSGAASYGAMYPTVHLAEPSESVPNLLGAASCGVPTINVGVPVGLWGWDMGMKKVQKRTWNGGFNGFGVDHGSDQVLGMVDYPENRAKAEDFGSVLETSKELSSMPNLQECVPEYRCEFCFKKKRLCGDNRRLNEGLNFNQTSHALPMNGGQNLPQQHLENNQNFNGLIDGFSKKEPRSSAAYSSNHNLSKGVDVVAIHRKKGINSSVAVGGGNHVFMEYDFFPRRSTSSKVEEASVTEALSGEASDTNSTFVDLSLKLSY
ncbi:hypothetical protein SLEP1_g49941 [Rubroshorea leprosula]|uniref:Uncharacterized protein n=2 Tax=Rubroshorea leprosula TaxID=152421 RepID=A0AAV5M1Q9_9ROSI|nr:hypothetical protein SLEP1_g49941 [Rubroshorea leprosula]